MPKHKILKLNAKQIIQRCALLEDVVQNEFSVSYDVKLDNIATYHAVVDELLTMESCALFDQLQYELGIQSNEEIAEALLQELVILDFSELYKKKSKIPRALIEKLISNGFVLRYNGQEVHMLPFDKSGNMSRKCRLSFLNAQLFDGMNERLNLGINFSKIPLKLSKYYAYRGLYLSTAKRIEHEFLEFNPKTLIVIPDFKPEKKKPYQRNVFIETGDTNEGGLSKIVFKREKVDEEVIDTPYDGQGIISPFYADCINEVLNEMNINSFQIRLPFAKGMLHRVDFHQFFSEHDKEVWEQEEYIIVDAFGIPRNLKDANIIMTKSMFKCADWLKKSCNLNEDPMQVYCDALDRYRHTLYISGTDLPYGHSKVTHLSYQLLNTLDLSKQQFASLIAKQFDYIQNPIQYIAMCQGQCFRDDDENGAYYDFPNWQKAVLVNPIFGHIKYINDQLKNVQAALMTKLVLGKLVVHGQMRYMVRDLPMMLVNMIQTESKRKELKNYKIFPYRFFLPQGHDNVNQMDLDYHKYYGFFRSPHLSRNEQGVLAPVTLQKNSGVEYRETFYKINKYFLHLTGVVMFGNQSLEPMALGGADFDGDLTSMIDDRDVVNAILSGVYQKTPDKDGSLDYDRKPEYGYIKIPSLPANNEVVPRIIPFTLIDNTFSDKIGLISNAAISIGQSEYGTKGEINTNITCSQCTILTGLEIDAAKNGVHPDLSALEDNEQLTTCNYLKFKKEFENLKKNKDYHFNQLEYKKAGDKHILGVKGKPLSIQYEREEGTWINELPIVFMSNLEPPLNIPNKKKASYFDFPEEQINPIKEALFKEECKKIFDVHKYYVELEKHIHKDSARDNNSRENLEKLLRKQYDEKRVEHILRCELPYIYSFIAERLDCYRAFKDIQENINKMRWHVQPNEKRCECLASILNVGLEELDLEKWSIVLHPYNQGYKILWYIVQDIGKMLDEDYVVIKQNFKKVLLEDKLVYMTLSRELDKILKDSLHNKETGPSNKIYYQCLQSLKELLAEFEISNASKIKILFEMSKRKNREARFFWDCFEWEELEKYIVKESQDVR